MPLPDVPAFLQCSECGFGQHTDRRTGDWYSSMTVSKDHGMEFRFQCCPEHARRASEEFTPFELDGFGQWEDPKHDLVPDHMVAADPVEISKLLPQTIAEALAHHRREPLEWEKINDHTERAFDPVSGEHIYRPYLSDMQKMAVRSSAATLAEAMKEAGDAPQKALEGFLKAVRGNDERMAPLYSAPGPAALEDRETYSFIRKSLGTALSTLTIDDDAIARVRATALDVVSGVLGDKGSVERMDINVTKEGQLDISMDLSYAPSAPAKEILLEIHKTKEPEILTLSDADFPPPVSGFARLDDEVDQIRKDAAFAAEQLRAVRQELSDLKQNVSFLNVQPEPITGYTAILPGASSVEVKIAPEWDQGLNTATFQFPYSHGNDSWELSLAGLHMSEGRHLVVFTGNNGVTHQQYLTYRCGEWFLG